MAMILQHGTLSGEKNNNLDIEVDARLNLPLIINNKQHQSQLSTVPSSSSSSAPLSSHLEPLKHDRTVVRTSLLLLPVGGKYYTHINGVNRFPSYTLNFTI